MDFTSASASKYLKKLQDEKARLLHMERETSEYVLAEGEKGDPPAYDYDDAGRKIEDVDRKMLAIRHALHDFNMRTVLPESGVTIDEALILLALLSAKKSRLSSLASRQPKERLGVRRSGGGGSVIEYSYANYDVAQAEADYEAVSDEISKLQLELDLANQTIPFSVSV